MPASFHPVASRVSPRSASFSVEIGQAPRAHGRATLDALAHGLRRDGSGISGFRRIAPGLAIASSREMVVLPTLATLDSNDDEPLERELRLAALRKQAAVVRSLTDHIERFARPADATGLREQLAEELARLACRLLEATGTMTSPPPPPPVSGVFPRAPASEPSLEAPARRAPRSPDSGPSARSAKAHG